MLSLRMRARRNQKLTVSQFLKVYEGSEDKVELIDGDVWLMTGGTLRHSAVAVNILIALGVKLKGSGCRPFNSDAGVFLDMETMRYPDITITCDPRDLNQDQNDARMIRYPVAIFEVLSPSTEGDDSGWKIEQYKRKLPSLRLAALVHPNEETIGGFIRRDDGAPWTDLTLPRGSDLTLPHPVVTLTAAEIFAR